MKKIFFGVVIISLITLSISSQSILIKSPRAGSKWVQGKTMDINWVTNGSMNNQVKIRLYKYPGITKSFDISNKTYNDGKFKWEIPVAVNNGNYIVRIRTIDNKIWKDSGPIEIKSVTPDPKPGPPPPPPPPSNNNLPKINPNAANTLHPKYMKNNSLVINPIVIKFKPERDTINSGESVKLFYHYKDTVKAHIYNRTVFNGDELLNGKYPECDSFVIVTPKKTSRYELNLSSNFKTITRECKVIVNEISPPPPPPKTKSMPNAEYFKAIPDLVEFGKGTILKFKVTNATSIIIKDHDFKIIFSWSGKVTDVVVKTIPAKLRHEKNKFFMTASNKTGDFYGYAWARWKSVIRDFRIKSVNRQKIVFHYDYSLAETAKIMHLNVSTRKWESVLLLKCFNLSCEDDREIKYKPGEYKLILLGYEGIFESNIVKVN